MLSAKALRKSKYVARPKGRRYAIICFLAINDVRTLRVAFVE
jgi:hypothetical protein